ncbi:MAG: flagellar biosynthetic protein FliO [Armatimonadota bacterium]|nr:flagellar biosynthetic protein FliO [Armatimonadota bacterium]
MLGQRLPKASVLSFLLGTILLAVPIASEQVLAQDYKSQSKLAARHVASRIEQTKDRRSNVSDDYIASLEVSSDRETDPEPVSGVRILVSFVVVVGLAYLTMSLLRRYGGFGSAQIQEQRAMRVVASLSLGPGRSLHLVEVGSRKLVVGSTATNITMLAELVESDLASAPAAGSGEQWYNSRSFKDHLTAFLGTTSSNLESSRRVAHLLRDAAGFLQGKRLSLAELRGRLRNG